MKIKKVETDLEADRCDELLTKLIEDEKEYNHNIKSNFIVKEYFKTLYNNKNNVIFIALEDSKIVGYIYVKLNIPDKGPELEIEAFIDGLFVEKEYRNRKIATNLIIEAKKWAISKKAKYISLNVLSQNDVARNLYYKLGLEDFSVLLKQQI